MSDAWSFCRPADVMARLRNLGTFDADDTTAMNGFIRQRASEIRSVLSSRGVTASEDWQYDKPDAWELCVMTNAIGAAVDTMRRFATGAGESDGATQMEAEHQRLLGRIENLSIPGLDDGAAALARSPSSYATNNPTDTSNDPFVTRAMEF
jgi:hypothetical protein